MSLEEEVLISKLDITDHDADDKDVPQDSGQIKSKVDEYFSSIDTVSKTILEDIKGGNLVATAAIASIDRHPNGKVIRQQLVKEGLVTESM